ncbi:MAG: hypothetical protein NWF14_07015 [Candidatus Bathyarchaeota archaeon]|nr:hypothetical protein [Candidatus Bathyarchaeota archaeon]
MGTITTTEKDVKNLTQTVKQMARQAGAVLVGVASIDRFDPMPPLFDRAPRGHDPRDFVPDAKSVISIAQPVLNSVMEAPAALVDKEVDMVPPEVKHRYLEVLYNMTGHRTQDYMLRHIDQVVGQYLQLKGYRAMFFPTGGIHPKLPGKTEKEIWQGSSREWVEKYFGHTSGPFSHRHAATRAGLGEFGYNNIVLTKEFGPRQRFNSIITDAELVPDPLISKPLCLRDGCMLCVKACPMGAITLRDNVDKNQIFIDTPAKTDPTLCTQRRDHIPTCFYGDCNRMCPVPTEPKYLSKRLRTILEDWKQQRT